MEGLVKKNVINQTKKVLKVNLIGRVLTVWNGIVDPSRGTGKYCWKGEVSRTAYVSRPPFKGY